MNGRTILTLVNVVYIRKIYYTRHKYSIRRRCLTKINNNRILGDIDLVFKWRRWFKRC